LEHAAIGAERAAGAAPHRDESGDRFTAARDDDLLAFGDPAQEVGRRRLGLVVPDLDHGGERAWPSPWLRDTPKPRPVGSRRSAYPRVMSRDKVRVAVVFGGRSSEHAISCVSAGAVMSHLDPERFEVVPVGITREGAWVLATSDPRELVISDRALPSVEAGGTALALPGDPTRGGLVVLDQDRAGEVFSGVDVVFPVLHGPYGEDGTIQGLLEMAGVPYVGAGVLASAAAMDKEYAKKLLAAEGIPVGDHVVLRRGRETLTAEERERLGLPVFVKPARAGSSIGITRVTDWADLDAAIAVAREHDPKVLVEAAIVGREV